MKILVSVKRVIDHAVKIRVKSNKSGVETNNVKMAMNPFDEIAVEEAVRLKETGVATEVIVLSIGPQNVQETLRAALALGADRAIHIETELAPLSLTVARLLEAVVKQENPELVFLGKQAIDDDASQTGQMLAGLLGWAQGTFASKITVAKEKNEVTVEREVDTGIEVVNLKLPAVITTDLRLNTPRFPSLPNIMKSKQKPLTTLSPDALGVRIDEKTHQTYVKYFEPPQRKSGVIVDSAANLYEKLKNEAQVV